MKFPQCQVCTHKYEGEPACEAFPNKIPDELYYGDVSHNKPYKGDNGILFEPVPEILKET